MPLEQNGRALVTRVGSFDAMKRTLYRLMDADLIPCSACDQPAKRIDFQDAAEWYPHCLEHHYAFGEQWTGSTRFRAHHLWVAVYPEKVRAWIGKLSAEERPLWQVRCYDTRDLYGLLSEEDYGTQAVITYPTANAGFSVSIYFHYLTNDEYAYEIRHDVGMTSHMYGLVGTFASADEAKQHALQSEDMPQWVRLNTDKQQED